jgi:AcrR family transcriptional regulator
MMNKNTTEQKIIKAADKLFTQKGYAATKTRAIAEEAETNLALLNYYFGSKEKLYKKVVQEKFRILLGAIGPVMWDETIPLEDKIRLITENYTKLLIENEELPIFILNELTDIIYNNVSPLMLVKNIYQQYDKEKYKLLTDDLLQRAQVYYMKGIPYVGDTILREITDSAVKGYYSVPSDDTIRRAEEEEIMQKAMGVMKQFNPRLLEQYSSSTQ